MSRSNSLKPIGGRIGTKEPVDEGDIIDNRSLTQHAYVPVLEQRATKKRWYHAGMGVEHQDSNVGRFSADIQVADDDSGTGQANAKGTARWAVYPDEPDASEPKATGDTYTLKELRELSALNHREKDLFPAMKPGARQDEYVTLEVQIDDSQEGMMIYQEGCTLTGVLSEVKR